MDLLTNAVESIQVGVEDYRVGTRPRLLSAARNIHAGVLLLFKEALLRRSPLGSNEVLIKAKSIPVSSPGGPVVFVGVGRKTADTAQIRERFESLGIKTDWDRFKSIADVRNDIEHYYPTVTPESLRGLISSSFLLVRTFLAKELNEDPRELLGPVWQFMLDVADVYEAERKECNEAVDAVDWRSDTLAEGVREVRCPKCASDLLRPSHSGEYDEGFTLACRICGHNSDAETFVPQAVAAALDWESYAAVKDGGEEPYTQCPECYTDSYVVSEGSCAYCSHEVDRECARCGNTIPVSELESSPLCGYCAHVTSKDD